MQSLPLKYLGYTVAFQEVPDEVSLIINISGCPHKCEGCHSKYLWEYDGSYISNDLQKLINGYKDYITCVCFMGGEQNVEELKQLLISVKLAGYKTCLYSGLHTEDIKQLSELYNVLDYLKIGDYQKDKGGLNEKTTNQKFYKIQNNVLTDLTYIFQKEKR